MRLGSLTMTYFRMEGPHYHWRGFVSRSCSGWEGVVPKRYGRQTITCVLCRFLGVTSETGRQIVLGGDCAMYWYRMSLNYVFRVIGSSRTGN